MMSAAGCLLTEDQLLCGICLDVFNVPVTLPCGHNYCRRCIMRHWDTSPQCSCPSCKCPFYRKLDLRVNIFISEMAAQFRRAAGGGGGGVEEDLVKPGEVPCDVCTERQRRAVKSCLVCLASYCRSHLEPHQSAERLRRHQLSEPQDNLEGRMCKIHDKPLELFCSSCQACVCMLCPVLDHKSHVVVPLKEQFERKKTELGRTEKKIHRMIQERRSKIQEIKHLEEKSWESAERETRYSTDILSSVILTLETAKADLTQTIAEMQTAIKAQAGGHVRELEEEISELLRRRGEVERLSRTKDGLHFIQTLSDLSAPRLSRDWSEVRLEVPPFEEVVRTAMEQLEEMLGKIIKKMVLQVQVEQLQQFEVPVSLDPDTAHCALVLSADLKEVHHGAKKKKLPDGAGRFNPSCCVLGAQTWSSGRFYFQVRVQDKTRWTLGVARQSVERKGVVPLCPDNGHWTIWVKNGEEYAALAGSPLPLTPSSPVQTVGVFVDYDEGLVSFYDVDAAELLYSFTGCSFTEKLRPFFSPGLNDDGVNSAPLVISPVSGSDRETGDEPASLQTAESGERSRANKGKQC